MFVDLLITVVEYKKEVYADTCTDVDTYIGIHRYQCGNNTNKKILEREGFCSNYLANLEIGSEVSMYLRSSPSMHLPDHSDAKIPLLLGIF